MYWLRGCCFAFLRDWWPDYFPDFVDTCANSLVEVNCNNSSSEILIQKVKSYSNEERCDELNKTLARDRLEELCDRKRFCSPDTSKDSWLFHKRYANIHFYCGSKHNVILYWICVLKLSIPNHDNIGNYFKRINVFSVSKCSAAMHLVF